MFNAPSRVKVHIIFSTSSNSYGDFRGLNATGYYISSYIINFSSYSSYMGVSSTYVFFFLPRDIPFLGAKLVGFYVGVC
jgi:hypothetical protein